MAESQESFVHAFAAALNARDLDTLLGLISGDDFVLVPIRAVVEDTVYEGAAGLAQWLRDIDETWDELRVEIDEVQEPREGVQLVFGRTIGRGQQSAVPIEVETTWVARASGGKVSRIESFLDRDAAVRAAEERRD